ncbi:hypothetical protein [Falsiroseomonas tokyonensis]|uniref:Uncharacterized protein n=1 Tax=Falsiroseomonas tokyonensis TaxID=430521 RepID=A0ABV7C0X4_9PROT|nr:hypothetical protein [Falsiroseomonas tokyonensis]
MIEKLRMRERGVSVICFRAPAMAGNPACVTREIGQNPPKSKPFRAWPPRLLDPRAADLDHFLPARPVSQDAGAGRRGVQGRQGQQAVAAQLLLQPRMGAGAAQQVLGAGGEIGRQAGGAGQDVPALQVEVADAEASAAG